MQRLSRRSPLGSQRLRAGAVPTDGTFLVTVCARLHQQGMQVARSSPGHFDDHIRSEIDRWTQVVRASGAKAD